MTKLIGLVKGRKLVNKSLCVEQLWIIVENNVYTAKYPIQLNPELI